MTNGEKFKEVFGFGADGSRVIAVNATWWDCEFQDRKSVTKKGKEGNMSELEECPFCGGEAHIHFAHESSQIFVDENGLVTTSPMLCIVSCESCHAKTAPCSSAAVAISLWNARVEA